MRLELNLETSLPKAVQHGTPLRASVYPKSHHRIPGTHEIPATRLPNPGRDPAVPAAEFMVIFDKVKLGPDKLNTSCSWRVIRAYL